MLRPIPAKILRSTVTVSVCTSADTYQNQAYTDYTISRVHLQPTNEVRKTADNTDITLRSILFVDARISKPAFDWSANLHSAHNLGGDMRVTCDGETYTVVGCDKLKDDANRLHHWEISLV